MEVCVFVETENHNTVCHEQNTGTNFADKTVRDIFLILLPNR